MESIAEKQGFRITGWHFLIGIVSFFLVIITADVYFATLAYKTFSGEAAKNPYEAGLLYNRTLEQERASRDLGWASTITARPDGRILIQIRTADKAPVDGLSGNVVLTRPATEKSSMTLPLTPMGQGRYMARTSTLQGGWDIELSLSEPGKPAFTAQRRVLLR